MTYILNINELRAALGSSSLTDLKTDASNSSNMATAIANFCATDKLQGDGWQSIFKSLGEYQEVLSKRFEVAGALTVAITVVLNNLIAYMGDYEVIDTSKKEEIENTIAMCIETIKKLQGYIDAVDKVMEPEYDENGVLIGYKETGETKPRYSEEQRRKFQAKIESYQGQIDNVLQPYLEKINGLEAVYKKAEEELSSVFSTIEEFGSDVSSLTPHASVA